MAAALVLALLLAGSPLSFGERVEGERAVERVRYAFVIGATKPFDEVYPRSVVEKKVERELAEERVLARAFGMVVTPVLLAGEYDRIEGETRAPDQWDAIKKALGGDRRRIEEIVCRPLLVDRALRARFAFDQAIHETERQRARDARNLFLAGKAPPGATVVRLSRRGETPPGTDEMLARARADASGPKVPTPEPTPTREDLPLRIESEMAKVLERKLTQKGDVSTILEERTRFSVFRLVSANQNEWLAEALVVPKRDFDRWLDVETARETTGTRP